MGFGFYQLTCHLKSPLPHDSWVSIRLQCLSVYTKTYTGHVGRMRHRKCKEPKQQPSRAGSSLHISCFLVSLHFQSDILSTCPVLWKKIVAQVVHVCYCEITRQCDNWLLWHFNNITISGKTLSKSHERCTKLHSIWLRLSDADVALLKRLEEKRESARKNEKSGQPSLMVPMGRSAYADPLWTF